MSDEIKQFEVSLKALLVRGGALLMLRQSNGKWEFPGGRIHVGEESSGPEQALERELAEELGPDVRFTIGDPVAAWILPWGGSRAGEHVFIVGYLCRYLSGDIRISDEHVDYRWVTPAMVPDLDLVVGYGPVLERFWSRPPEP